MTRKDIGVVGLVMVGLIAGMFWPARGQDLTTDLALLLRGTVPRVTTDVNGATTFAVTPRFPWAYVLLTCEGAETIDTITGGRQGLVLYLEHTDTDCTLNDDETPTATDAIDLTGAATDVGAAAKMIMLLYNGTSWYELSESDN